MFRLHDLEMRAEMYERETKSIDLEDYSLPKIYGGYHNKIMNDESVDPKIVKILYKNYIHYFNLLASNCVYLYKKYICMYLVFKYTNIYDNNNQFIEDMHETIRTDLFRCLAADYDEGRERIIKFLEEEQDDIYHTVLIYMSESYDEVVKNVVITNELKDKEIPEELKIRNITNKLFKYYN